MSDSSRLRPEKKTIDGVKRCAYGECYAPLTPGAKSPYCHPDHAAAASRVRTLALQATKAQKKVYQQAIDRLTAKHAAVLELQHIGWFRTTTGVALRGDYAAELRAILRDVDDAMRAFGKDLTSGKVRLDRLQRNYVATFAKFHALTEELNRVLPQPKPNEHQ